MIEFQERRYILTALHPKKQICVKFAIIIRQQEHKKRNKTRPK